MSLHLLRPHPWDPDLFYTLFSGFHWLQAHGAVLMSLDHAATSDEILFWPWSVALPCCWCWACRP